MDRTEFDSWVWQVGPALHRTGFLLTGDWAQSQQLVVEACARAFADWDALAAPEAYARSFMAREVAGQRRRPAPAADSGQHAGLATMLGEEGPGQRERRTRMTAALDSMAPRERAALVLQYYDGLTEDQVARDLDLDAETVRAATDRALDVLRGRGLDDGWGA